jgi:hypothetical protein
MFHVVSYNIFARSLGSNCIPWVLQVSEEWEKCIENVTGKSFNAFVTEYLQPEYMKHFHKNHSSGSKIEMRQLWSSCIQNENEIPSTLSGLQFIDENCVEYVKQSDSQEGDIGNCKATMTNFGSVPVVNRAFTLPGILNRHLPADISTGLYAHIMETENHFLWQNRGPKIFHEITKENSDFNDCQVPDIISLCEYDVHEVSAEYRTTVCDESGNNTSKSESFSEALCHRGYEGMLMTSPDLRDNSGIGVYWRKEQFVLENGEIEGEHEYPIHCLRPGESYRNSAFNYDLYESCHKVRGDGLSVSSTHELLHVSERKNVSCVRLVHKETGKLVLILSVHLMTHSKDSKSNEFIGEIRAVEMKKIREIIGMHLDGSYLNDNYTNSVGGERSVEGVIVLGDFNTDVSFHDIFTGTLASTLSDKVLSVDTGVTMRSLSEKRVDEESVTDLHWHVDCAETSSALPSIIDGDVPQTSSVLTNKLIMREAFSNVHAWGISEREECSGSQYCTSYSSSRCEWIDLMWFSPSLIRLHEATPPHRLLAPDGHMPNAQHPSDHLPISAVFEFMT